ncbi:tyrosine-type recombinase/integrase [Pseudomonadota bacterium]
MPTTKLTGVAIENLKPGNSGDRVNYFDTAHKGLCLRVGSRDKTWTYHYRFNGKARSPSLGKFSRGRVDHMDRVAAIDAADKIDQLIQQGLDPKYNSPAVKSKPTVRNVNTFENLVTKFLKVYKIRGARKKRPVKPKTYKNAKSLLTGHHVSKLKNSDVRHITRVQIIDVLDAMADTPYQANRLHSYLSVFFNWCWNHGHVEISPLYKLEKIFYEKPRTRFLSVNEIKRLWDGCNVLGYPLGDLCKFILVTGQRPGECRRLDRNDISQDIWLVEGGDPKNDERHRIPLPAIARELVEKSPSRGAYVFSNSEGKHPCHQSGDEDKEIYDAVDLSTSWQLKDLRRTFHTQASEELDFSPHIIGVICNQKSVAKPGVARVYNQAKWIKQKRKALNKWNNWLLKVVKDE